MEKPLGTGSPLKTASPLREARRWRHQSVFPRPDGTGQSAFQFPQGTAWRRPASSIMVEPASASARGSRSSAIDQATDSTEVNAPIAESARMRSSMISKLTRSEEHTSELQSQMRNSYAIFCLKKKKNTK